MAFNLDNFLLSPGGGRDYAYSPVGVNATLDCKVASNDLTWSINNIEFDRQNERNFLHSRGIFQSEFISSSEGLFSTVFMFGNISNNASMVCCQSFLEEQMMSCTTLIIYGKLYLCVINVSRVLGYQIISMPVLARWYNFSQLL